MADLASRLHYRIQLTTDAWQPYPEAVDLAFGKSIDYMQVKKTIKLDEERRYSPPKVVSTYSKTITGNPNQAAASTSLVERQNLTMRMQMRRFTRLTNGFSKTLAGLKAAVALHFAHYNLVRIHQTLQVTPAMEAGVTKRLWDLEDLLLWEEVY